LYKFDIDLAFVIKYLIVILPWGKDQSGQLAPLAE
jgi:hypothetical protein